MKILTIVGARPQFIKAASVIRAIKKHNLESPNAQVAEVLVHTGQHYDHGMSRIFFEELEIPEPDYNLGVGSGTHGKMTGAILERIEEVLFEEKPDTVLVYGDTNSTLAGALAAAKLYIPVAHVEAGLRSYNRQMPEEINRVLTDHVSSLLFCPADTAVKNLKKEGILNHVYKVGDVMYDSFLFNKQLAEKKSDILTRLDLIPKRYCLGTVHRQENTDNEKRLCGIFDAFGRLAIKECPLIIPLHPRTQKIFEKFQKGQLHNPYVRIVPPASYLDMILLEMHAKMILTDSGGIQKEAYFAGVPCVTLRDETEWVETVQAAWNVLAGADAPRIVQLASNFSEPQTRPQLYGDGKAAEQIARLLGCCITT